MTAIHATAYPAPPITFTNELPVRKKKKKMRSAEEVAWRKERRGAKRVRWAALRLQKVSERRVGKGDMEQVENVPMSTGPEQGQAHAQGGLVGMVTVPVVHGPLCAALSLGGSAELARVSTGSAAAAAALPSEPLVLPLPATPTPSPPPITQYAYASPASAPILAIPAFHDPPTPVSYATSSSTPATTLQSLQAECSGWREVCEAIMDIAPMPSTSTAESSVHSILEA